MNFITAEQFGGIVRAVGSTALTYAIAKGWVSPADSEWLVAGAVALATGGWSWWTNRPAKIA
jgi:hypothetical protein